MPNPVLNRKLNSGQIFTPMALAEMAAWWDFTDLSTMSINGSNLIASITSKVGGHIAAQSTDANKPTYTANTLNGKSVAAFDGGDELTFSGTTLDMIRNVDQYEFMAVARATGGSGTARFVLNFSTNGATTSRANLLFSNANQFQIGGRRLDADSADSLSNGTVTLNTWYIFGSAANYGTTNIDMYRNSITAVANKNPWLTAGSTSNTASARAGIGSTGNASSFLIGQIAHVFIFKPILSTYNRTRLIEWLSRECAITLT
jgi:hypothetical protein